MEFLDYSHNQWLVAASLLVALMAGFTGLSLTKGLSERTVAEKKIIIVLAAVALGGGIWSMHFVAMLGLQMPILVYYDAVITLVSALVAILVVGLALLILHFRARTRATLVAAGTIVGLGVLAMHYIGMAGLQYCQALYTATGLTLAVIASCALNILAFVIAYGRRTHRNIVLGTIVFGCSVFAVHFVAIWGTNFLAVDVAAQVGPVLSNEVMAIGVILTSFVLCGAFLLTGVTFVTPEPSVDAPTPTPEPPIPEPAPAPESSPQTISAKIPYEQNGRTHFVAVEDVYAVRAEGHYTNLYTQKDKLFCVWSITEAEKRLTPGRLVKVHRSYLINPAHVSSFERLKDNGVCHFEAGSLKRVPVSRSRLPVVREALGV